MYSFPPAPARQTPVAPDRALQQLPSADLTKTPPRGILGRDDLVRGQDRRACCPPATLGTPPPPSPQQQKYHQYPQSSPAVVYRGYFLVGVGETHPTAKGQEKDWWSQLTPARPQPGPSPESLLARVPARSPEGAAPSRAEPPERPPRTSARSPSAPDDGRPGTSPSSRAARTSPRSRAVEARKPHQRPRRRATPGRPAGKGTPLTLWRPRAARGVLLLPRRRTFPPALRAWARLHLRLRQPRSLRGPGGAGSGGDGGGGRAEPRPSPSARLRVGAAGPRAALRRPAGVALDCAHLLPQRPSAVRPAARSKRGALAEACPPSEGALRQTRGPLQVGSFARDWSPRSRKVEGRG